MNFKEQVEAYEGKVIASRLNCEGKKDSDKRGYISISKSGHESASNGSNLSFYPNFIFIHE